MRLMDIILAFPSLLLALVLVAILGPGLTNAMIAIALVLQPHFVRLTRAAVMTRRTGLRRRRRSPAPGTLRLMFRPSCRTAWRR
jgi:dipeptide transport system permease protein